MSTIWYILDFVLAICFIFVYFGWRSYVRNGKMKKVPNKPTVHSGAPMTPEQVKAEADEELRMLRSMNGQSHKRA